MNRTKHAQASERKPAARQGKDGKMLSRLERMEQIHRNVKGALNQLEILLAEEKKQAGN